MLAFGSFIFPIKETIALATVLFTVSTVSKSLLHRRQVDWNLVIRMTIVSTPFTFLGAYLMVYAPGELLKKLLAVMVLLYVVMVHFKLKPKIKLGVFGTLLGTGAYGFTSGLIGSGNLIKAILFSELGISKQAFVGAMAATAVVGNFVKLFTYAHAGLFNAGQTMLLLALIASAVVAAFLGKAVISSVTETRFKQGVQAILVIAALGLLF